MEQPTLYRATPVSEIQFDFNERGDHFNTTKPFLVIDSYNGEVKTAWRKRYHTRLMDNKPGDEKWECPIGTSIHGDITHWLKPITPEGIPTKEDFDNWFNNKFDEGMCPTAYDALGFFIDRLTPTIAASQKRSNKLDEVSGELEKQLSLNNKAMTEIGQLNLKIAALQEENKVKDKLLSEISPLIDLLIERLPTGKSRNEVCDFNIKLKSALTK